MSDFRVVITPHAEQRIAERGVDRGTLVSMVLAPTVSGPTDGARWAAGSVLVGTHREWLTAIYQVEGADLVVLTTYPGPPSRKRTTDAARSVGRT